MSGLEGYCPPIWVEIDRIDPRPASEVRARADEEAIEDYAARETDAPPILVVAGEGDVHWIVDGRHRFEAAILRGVTSIQCRIKRGTYLDAFRDAAHANAEHGVRVTNADKRARVLAALAHEQMGRLSVSQIADLCYVSRDTVHRLRPEPKQDAESTSSKVIGKDGKSYPAKKAKKEKKPKTEASSAVAPDRDGIEDNPAIAPDPTPEPLPGQTGLPVTDPDDAPGQEADEVGSPEATKPEPETSDDEAQATIPQFDFTPVSTFLRQFQRSLSVDSYRQQFAVDLLCYAKRVCAQLGVEFEEVTIEI